MKKVILLAFTAIVLSSAAHSQIDKGTVLLGGDIGFNNNKAESNSSSSNNNSKFSSIGISPTVGITIKPNTIIGIQLRYSHSKSSSEPGSGTDEFTGYDSEVFIRRYLGLGKGFYLFAQPGIYYSNDKNEYRYSNSKQTTRSWETGINLYPGVSYAVNKSFHLEAGLGNVARIFYRHTEVESKTIPSGTTADSKGDAFSFSSSLSSNAPISIGFRFFL